MQAILLTEVDGLGEAGAVVTVARGYMRNYLLPRGMAEVATPGRIAEVQRREEQRRQAEIRAEEQSKELADLLGRTILTLKAKAGDDGRLFGSITAENVADAIFEARQVKVDRHKVLIDPPIRAVGTYEVPVELAPGVEAKVKTIVSPLLD